MRIEREREREKGEEVTGNERRIRERTDERKR